MDAGGWAPISSGCCGTQGSPLDVDLEDVGTLVEKPSKDL